MKFPESALAHRLLDGLHGIEIGGAAHNAFGLTTWNVDRTAPSDPHRRLYEQSQIDMCGEVMAVDVVGCGDVLPFRDKSLDFVISSHVIEHFYDPISALHEWARVASRFVFLICPQRDALPVDVGRPLTSLDELRERHRNPLAGTDYSDDHYSRWTSQTFCELCESEGFRVVATEDPDLKVGNGFTIVIDLQATEVTASEPVPAARRRLGLRRWRAAGRGAQPHASGQ